MNSQQMNQTERLSDRDQIWNKTNLISLFSASLMELKLEVTRLASLLWC